MDISGNIRDIEGTVGRLSRVQKILLGTDGSVTQLLESITGNPVTVKTLVQEIVPKYRPEFGELTIVTEPSDDLRSYHVNSDKITRVLGFKPQFTVADAISDLCQAFSNGLLPNSFDDDRYFNVRQMKVANVR